MYPHLSTPASYGNLISISIQFQLSLTPLSKGFAFLLCCIVLLHPVVPLLSAYHLYPLFLFYLVCIVAHVYVVGLLRLFTNRFPSSLLQSTDVLLSVYRLLPFGNLGM